MPEEDGTYAAMCDEHFCPTKFYTREELVRYTINPQKLLPAIARWLGLHPQVRPVADAIWSLGQVPGTPTVVPVLFTRVKDACAMKRVLQLLIVEEILRFVLVTPTARYGMGGYCASLLSRDERQVFSLEEVTEIKGPEPILTETGRVRWQKVKEIVGGATVLGATFPTPPGADWHDLSLVFRDGHTVTASIGSVRETYTFQDMGMVNRNTLTPDEQWQLLYHFAEEMGVFTWRSQHADHRNKRRKGRLAARLRAFFGIPGNPFAYRRKDGGWEAIFNIRIES